MAEFQDFDASFKFSSFVWDDSTRNRQYYNPHAQLQVYGGLEDGDVSCHWLLEGSEGIKTADDHITDGGPSVVDLDEDTNAAYRQVWSVQKVLAETSLLVVKFIVSAIK